MEEINLRQLIEMLVRGKWIIIIFTVVCMVVSGFASFFLFDPIYEAKTKLLISPVNTEKKTVTEDSIKELVAEIAQSSPSMSIETYKEQVKSPQILNYIKTEMGMKNTSLIAIAKKISVDTIKNTNLISISVEDKNPEVAAKIANIVSDKFTDFISETSREQAAKSAEYIKKQQEAERVNLDKASENLKNFVAQPRGPEELKQELESKLTQLTEFKTELSQVRIDEQAARASVEKGKRVLQGTPQTRVLTKELLDDEILSGIVKERTGVSTKEALGIKVTSEEINDIYTDLAQKVNELTVELESLTAKRQSIETEISLRQKDIENLQAELAEKQQKFDMLSYELDLSKQTYDAYQQKYKEAIIKQSAEVGRSSIIVVTEAIPPITPVAPNKKLNILMAMAFGFIISVFGVFLREYWKNSKVEQV